MSVERGRTAEGLAADYLVAQGFTVIERNWRNRWCELDLVVRGHDGIHIVEVKYRRRSDWGDGFEAITRDKITRLRRAAIAWVQAHHYNGPYQIDVVSVTGELPQAVIDHLPGAISD